MSQLQPKLVHAPEIGPVWLNSPPLSMRGLRGRAVLVDFWDYTCVNCIRTLPYLNEWRRRYWDKGLTIVGVHAPEFYFAGVPELVELALGDFGIEYPVMLDNDYQVWQAFANKYWPSKYLIDAEGYLRYAAFGEGHYRETEEAIQQVLREIDPTIALPEPMAPLRPMDAPGAIAACRRPTPELYLGYSRGKIANPEGLRPDEVYPYRFGAGPGPDTVELDGLWESRSDCLEAKGECRLRLRYEAAEVNLVMSSGVECPVASVEIRDSLRGVSRVEVSRPRMYRLLGSDRFQEGTLELRTSSPGLQMFAFTFVSCL
ncbi:MAG: redoxin family protein [Bryobacteraceae bacterium]|nr:redoxin family protein [Bryobacteraceae bacterium]